MTYFFKIHYSCITSKYIKVITILIPYFINVIIIVWKIVFRVNSWCCINLLNSSRELWIRQKYILCRIIMEQQNRENTPKHLLGEKWTIKSFLFHVSPFCTTQKYVPVLCGIERCYCLIWHRSVLSCYRWLESAVLWMWDTSSTGINSWNASWIYEALFEA